MLLALLQALRYWLEIQAIRARWTLERDIEAYVAKTELELVQARARGDDALADRLLQSLARSSGIAFPSAPAGDSAPSTGGKPSSADR